MSGRLRWYAVVGLVVGVTLAFPTAAQQPDRPKTVELDEGARAPNFSGFTFDERVFHLKGLLAKKKRAPRFVVVSFWSTTCKHCRKGLRVLDTLLTESSRNKIHVVLVACDQESESANPNGTQDDHLKLLMEWLDQAGVKSHRNRDGRSWFLRDPDLAIATRYGVFSAGQLTLPQTFVVDRKRKVVRVFAGEGKDFEEEIRAAVKRKRRKGGK